jgi:hypothetical protein
MAIRNDITIDWSVNPRIITIQAPSLVINLQDLYDTLRDKEVMQMDEHSIVLGSGKESLGGGLFVGLTITLHDALLSFEARPGPTYEQCRVIGGNLVAQIEGGGYYDTPIFPTSFTQVVVSASSSATLLDGTSQITQPEIDSIADAVWNKTLGV